MYIEHYSFYYFYVNYELLKTCLDNRRFFEKKKQQQVERFQQFKFIKSMTPIQQNILLQSFQHVLSELIHFNGYPKICFL